MERHGFCACLSSICLSHYLYLYHGRSVSLPTYHSLGSYVWIIIPSLSPRSPVPVYHAYTTIILYYMYSFYGLWTLVLFYSLRTCVWDI